MKTSTIVILGGSLALLVVLFLVFKDKILGTAVATATSAEATTSLVALGKKDSGTPYYESDVQQLISQIKSDAPWYNTVKAKANAAGISLAKQLRMDAIWTLEHGL